MNSQETELLCVTGPGVTLQIDQDKIYASVLRKRAREDILAYLADEGYDEDAAQLFVDDKFIEYWLRCISNHETIAECRQLTAVAVAQDFGHKWYGTPKFKTNDVVILHTDGDQANHSGETALVLRELEDGKEYDLYDVGYMYAVRCECGEEIHVFQNEISIVDTPTAEAL